MNLPTKITFSRIIATVILIVTLFVLSLIPNLSTPELGNSRINLVFLIVFVFFVIASYTDHLDGKLARKNNQVTDLGKFLDPVADKLLVTSMLIFLCAYHVIAPYAIEQTAFIANIFGKLKTVLQMVAIGAVLLNDFPFHYMYPNNTNPYLTVTMFIVYAATLASLLSGIIYVWQNRKAFLESK